MLRDYLYISIEIGKTDKKKQCIAMIINAL